MSELHVLYKASGQKVEVNDTSLSHALSLGWTVKSPDEIAAEVAAAAAAKAASEAAAAKAVKK